jgi:hypothetical protein
MAPEGGIALRPNLPPELGAVDPTGRLMPSGRAMVASGVPCAWTVCRAPSLSEISPDQAVDEHPEDNQGQADIQAVTLQGKDHHREGHPHDRGGD